ncbi:MAG: prolyl oligopeptidase family serine peptidase [Pirellulales bacterium]|nr:prolyl oligopeptidase family serine peptidase [Pirellulales bacterium]
MRSTLPRVIAFLLGLSIFSFLVVTSATAMAVSQDDEGQDQEDNELTLEKLFPEKGLFGPRASGAAFSHDGKYAAYLYRPYVERRHGSDLWLLDVESGEPRRLTSVSLMAKFQQATKKVQDDRVKKAKATGNKKDAEEDNDKDEAESNAATRKNGDWVSDKDADDEDAPRYGGITGFVWSPSADELLFTSGGDVYRYQVEDDAITRLTKTKDAEAAVDYTPDGGGYTYISGNALLRVNFGSHFVEELEPRLPPDENMTSYQLSEDGTRLAFLTQKGDSWFGVRTVKIVNYRGRFAEVRETPRTVSDDKLPELEITAYVYQIPDEQMEDGTLYRVHREKIENPQDIFSTPSWSADSNRAVFSVYEYTSGLVNVFQANLSEEDLNEDEGGKDKDEGDQESEDNDEKGAEKQESESTAKDDDKTQKDEYATERAAQVVYRFLHFGGPNTPSMMQPEYLADNRRIVMLTEQTGFRQLHVLDPVYQSMKQLTGGNFEIIPQELSKDRSSIFVVANKDNPARNNVFKVDLESGEMEQLTENAGVYSDVAVSSDGSAVLGNYVTYGRLGELSLIQDGDAKDLTDSHPEKAHELTQAKPEFFNYENRNGQTIHGMLFKPDGWSKDDKRPLLVYVYGGPLGTRKMVDDGSYAADAYFFAWYMAKKHGYVTATIDPRGVSGYGGFFEKSNFDQIGKPQVEDLTDGVKFLIENFGVDEKRVGIHGWSFGGFQTQMCLYTAPEVFAVGIAGAGPTEWENYNAWYTSGTIGPSKPGEATLKKFSLLPLAKNLKGKLLLVHGMEDANVLYQDTVRVYRELLKAGKEALVELFVDPTGGHGLGGDVKRLNRYRKYEEFLLRTLGTTDDSSA